MAKPLKVYYCRKCGCRMPLYYKEENGFRNDEWKFCIACKSHDIFFQVEVWEHQHEMQAKKATSLEDRVRLQKSAKLFGKEEKKKEIDDVFS